MPLDALCGQTRFPFFSIIMGAEVAESPQQSPKLTPGYALSSCKIAKDLLISPNVPAQTY